MFYYGENVAFLSAIASHNKIDVSALQERTDTVLCVYSNYAKLSSWQWLSVYKISSDAVVMFQIDRDHLVKLIHNVIMNGVKKSFLGHMTIEILYEIVSKVTLIYLT